MSYPSDGVAVQNACYADFGSCFVDTFYREKLLKGMVDEYQASKYAVLAYVDSISNYLTYDTTFYHGQPYYVDTFQTEKVWISIQGSLKDSLPVSRLSYVDRWVAFTGNPYATTYTPLVDTPFVAMFNQYDSIRQLGVGPMDGCFFEPTALTIIDGHIHKKGLVGERMPGVSVAWEDFFRAIGRDPVAAPAVREKHVGIRRSARTGSFPSDLPGAGRYFYDLRGRRLIEGRKSSGHCVTETRAGKDQHAGSGAAARESQGNR
ncbi:MAG: hypothetical protein JWP91_1308 [Fibrobacteres bacterium]|nr:hypothetical protein [Fibrobacterota bacterium]